MKKNGEPQEIPRGELIELNENIIEKISNELRVRPDSEKIKIIVR